MSKISVIIPAYNSSLHLRECLDSIIYQTHKDLEIILVDDCSKDNTYEIMREYALKDNRIILIKNPSNMGAGASRNVGLDNATGNYVTFVDSDDFLDLDTYRKVNEAIVFNSFPDIVRFEQNSFLEMGKLRVNVDFLTNNLFNGLEGVLNPKTSQRYVALESPGVCNKVFKRELIGDTRFVEGKKWEDYPFCTFMLGKADRIAFTNAKECGYNYRHSINFTNTTLSDIKKPTERMLEIYDCCDVLSQEFKDADLFDIFEDALRGNQKINSIQRVRDILFTRNYSHNKKREVINSLLNLTEIKYGSVFDDKFYLSLKRDKMFYRARMFLIEAVYSDGKLRKEKSEEVVKEKIKRLL